MSFTETEKLQTRTLSRGIRTKLFNKQVGDRYSDNQDLLDACSIQPYDTIPEIIDKKIDFFFTLDNFAPQVIEKIRLRNKPKKGEGEVGGNLPWMYVHLKFKERYININGILKPTGQRRIKVSNIDLGKTTEKLLREKLEGLTLTYGSSYVTYNFNNGKEIRLEHVDTINNGRKIIEQLIPLTLNEYQHSGEVSKNIFTVTPPENTPTVDMHGYTGYAYKLSFHKQEGKKTIKLFSLLLANKARDKK
jgi:hypothetical protein